jgi:hypothetical protein
MFGTDPKSLAQTLGAMERESREACNFDQTAAKSVFQEYLRRDIRFAPFDPERLVDRVKEAMSNGRTLDLDDPWLRPGGSKRPLDF